MWQYPLKVLLSAVLIVAIAEIAKRSSFWAAALASLPITSVLAFIWLHMEGGKSEQIADLSQGIFWLVLPSLVLFVALPWLLRAGWQFWPSLLVACAATAGAYAVMAWGLPKLGIQL